MQKDGAPLQRIWRGIAQDSHEWLKPTDYGWHSDDYNKEADEEVMILGMKITRTDSDNRPEKEGKDLEQDVTETHEDDRDEYDNESTETWDNPSYDRHPNGEL